MVGYEAGDVIEGFVVQLLVVHFRELVYSVVQISGALATVLPVSTFANTVADAVAGGVGRGAVGWGEGVCDLGGFVVGNNESLRCESTLSSQRISLRIVDVWNGDSAYITVLCGCLLTVPEKLHCPLLHLLVRPLLRQRLRRDTRERLLSGLMLFLLYANNILLPVTSII